MSFFASLRLCVKKRKKNRCKKVLLSGGKISEEGAGAGGIFWVEDLVVLVFGSDVPDAFSCLTVSIPSFTNDKTVNFQTVVY